MLFDYEANRPPTPEQWLRLDPEERIEAARLHHLWPPRGHPAMPDRLLHARLHAQLETHLADGFQPLCDVIERLMGDGCTRHEALHAVEHVMLEGEPP